MNHTPEFEPSFDQTEFTGACPIDPERARRLSAEVLRSKLADMTTPLVGQPASVTNTALDSWKRLKAKPPTGAEVFYFRNTHGR